MSRASIAQPHFQVDAVVAILLFQRAKSVSMKDDAACRLKSINKIK
jgi:hypothetical protein